MKLGMYEELSLPEARRWFSLAIDFGELAKTYKAGKPSTGSQSLNNDIVSNCWQHEGFGVNY